MPNIPSLFVIFPFPSRWQLRATLVC